MSRYVLHAACDGLISVREVSGVAVASVEVPSVRERQAAEMRERLIELAREHGGRLIVSMGAVEDLSSACIIALLAAGRRCDDLRGRLVVMGLPPEVRRLVKSSGIDRTLNVVDDLAEALTTVRGGRRGRGLLGFGRPAA